MTPFHLDSDDLQHRLRLTGEITVEHARPLHAALAAALTAGSALHIDARDLTRIDAAILQVLAAAGRIGARPPAVDVSTAWTQALQRYGFADTAQLFPQPPQISLT